MSTITLILALMLTLGMVFMTGVLSSHNKRESFRSASGMQWPQRHC